jgi:hypothetical protein
MPTWNMDDPLGNAVRSNGMREAKRANKAARDYMLMGTARSLRKLLAKYMEDPSAPTKSWTTIQGWSMHFDWVKRAERFDLLQQQAAQEMFRARQQHIMQSGLALIHERVEKLNKIFERLYENFESDDKLWLPDTKGIGSNENFREVEIVRFNTGLVSELRGVLEDIASETGGRIKETKNTGSIQLVQVTSDDMAKARQTAEDFEKSLLGDDGNSE